MRRHNLPHMRTTERSSFHHLTGALLMLVVFSTTESNWLLGTFPVKAWFQICNIRYWRLKLVWSKHCRLVKFSGSLNKVHLHACNVTKVVIVYFAPVMCLFSPDVSHFNQRFKMSDSVLRAQNIGSLKSCQNIWSREERSDLHRTLVRTSCINHPPVNHPNYI